MPNKIVPSPALPPVNPTLWGENALVAPPNSVPAQIPSRWVEWRPRRIELGPVLLGQVLAVLGCALSVIVFLRLDATIASVVVVVAIVSGGFAVGRRIPLAVWWTAGLIIGGVLGRFS